MQVHSNFSCPICSNAISGAQEIGYLCKNCNILFGEHHIEEEKTTPLRIAPTYYVCAPSSNTAHLSSCKYAKRIENPVTLFPAELKNYRLCGCIKRQNAV